MLGWDTFAMITDDLAYKSHVRDAPGSWILSEHTGKEIWKESGNIRDNSSARRAVHTLHMNVRFESVQVLLFGYYLTPSVSHAAFVGSSW